jgi:DNA repair exonuclease SbcCD nuclease subunit
MILVIGDLHFRESMSYADHIDDRRIGEKKEVLDFIVKQAEDCTDVVIVGDALNLRNNPSEVIREFVAFIERFADKQLYIIAGNHEKRGNGKTAIDFLGEIDKPNWHIMARPSAFEISGLKVDFLPYMTKHELGVQDNVEGAKLCIDALHGGDILFHHHAVSDTVSHEVMTNLFNEIVLPKTAVEKKYKLVVGGHIHTPGEYGKTVVTGSVFNADMGETKKYVWKIDPKTIKAKKIALPGRGIYKLVNPTEKDISQILVHNIVKVIVTDRSIDVEAIKKLLSKHDAHLIVEQYPDERERVHFEDGAIDLSVEHLIDIYAEAKKVNKDVLLKGYELIR